MFRPTWPSSGVKKCLMRKSQLSLVADAYAVPLMRVCVCNTYEFSIRIRICEDLYVWFGYSFVYSLWLLCYAPPCCVLRFVPCS
jgi:hypothetical protein